MIGLRVSSRAFQLVWALALVNLGYAAYLIAANYAFPGAAALAAPDRPAPDFVAFWAAGRHVLEGTPALAYDWEAHRATTTAGIGYDHKGWMPWHYPPSFQLLVAPFAAAPFWPAMALWVGLTGALYLWTCWRILPGALGLGAALAAMPTVIILINGQTGFLLAAALGLGLLALERRPWLAGLGLALLSIKPTLGLGLPVALAAGGRWRALAAAAAASLALAGLSVAVLGPEPWAAFLASLIETAQVFSGANTRPRYAMGASPYTALRHLGLGTGPALAAQAVVALAVLALLARAWAAPATPPALKAALLCFATAAATPRILGYDLHILVIGALFELRHARAAGLYRGEGHVLLAALLAAFLSALFQPGLNWALAPGLFLACWLGHARDSYRRVAPDSPDANRPGVPSGTSRD